MAVLALAARGDAAVVMHWRGCGHHSYVVDTIALCDGDRFGRDRIDDLRMIDRIDDLHMIDRIDNLCMMRFLHVRFQLYILRLMHFVLVLHAQWLLLLY